VLEYRLTVTTAVPAAFAWTFVEFSTETTDALLLDTTLDPTLPLPDVKSRISPTPAEIAALLDMSLKETA
jgi:hypothetical protein